LSFELRNNIQFCGCSSVLTIAALLVATVSFAAAVPDSWTDKLKVMVANVQSAITVIVERVQLLFGARTGGAGALVVVLVWLLAATQTPLERTL
jgi:hypothetical protein